MSPKYHIQPVLTEMGEINNGIEAASPGNLPRSFEKYVTKLQVEHTNMEAPKAFYT